ncbi:ribulose-bisphosphate carboxylase large subunit family protein [Mesobacillus foraminis]|uniref:ribulose-bisphosphate carboxylase large subunit family protein n=1 Tax=Mesobacillus foraminis TaxID=279826 RepID=UPI001BEA2A99|nr:ribulose-bisphosphate carboxylase large subunit family protein [Mesobacillus foraminis]MBT2757799.1 ribulose-bisphosphate carboxylase large subunit family protein [Mesobacillus foraminis]
MGQDRLLATYLVETPHSLEHAAEVIANEQSTGTFTSVPGETDLLKERFRAKVVSIKELEQVNEPSLPGVKRPINHDGIYRRGEIVVSFPVDNFGPSIPNLLSAVAGNLFELQDVSGLRLMDLDLPEIFSTKYSGPKFGIEGTRRLVGVKDRPIFGTIVKPSIGLPLESLHGLVTEMALAGLDFIKDDELNANPPYAPLEKKIEVVMDAINRASDKTGRKLMYAFNITGDIDELERNHELVVKAGGTCAMVSINSIGISGLAYLNSFSEVPIHAHRNQWGMLTRYSMLGMEFTAYQKLCRLAGADQLHVNGLNSKFYESNASVVRSIKACTTPIFGGYRSLPVVSSGQWAGMALDTYKAAESVDVMHLAGGGILGHPNGPAAGFESMRLGWEAAVQGRSIEDYSAKFEVLRKAIEEFS